jgi:hypothetical protein
MTALGWSTPYHRRKTADHRLGVATYTIPATLYLGFTTSILSQNASSMPSPSIEAAGNGYQRTPVTMDATTWSTADGNASSTNIITIGLFTASAAWTTPAYGFFFSDALSGGNFWFAGGLYDSSGLVDPVLPLAGQQVVFPPGAIEFTLGVAA